MFALFCARGSLNDFDKVKKIYLRMCIMQIIIALGIAGYLGYQYLTNKMNDVFIYTMVGDFVTLLAAALCLAHYKLDGFNRPIGLFMFLGSNVLRVLIYVGEVVHILLTRNVFQWFIVLMVVVRVCGCV